MFIKLKKCLVMFIICLIFSTNVICSSYIYPVNKNKEIKVSSISTFASTPEFNFQSQSQVLMEPTTGEILYANNENEKLLPASVTKVMTS